MGDIGRPITALDLQRLDEAPAALEPVADSSERLDEVTAGTGK